MLWVHSPLHHRPGIWPWQAAWHRSCLASPKVVFRYPKVCLWYKSERIHQFFWKAHVQKHRAIVSISSDPCDICQRSFPSSSLFELRRTLKLFSRKEKKKKKTGPFPIIKKLTRASCSFPQLYLFALFPISEVALHHFPPLHLLIFVNTKLRRTICCCIAISSVKLFHSMTKSLMTVCFIQWMDCVLAALLCGIFSKFCSHLLALLSTLLAPPLPAHGTRTACSDPTTVVLVQKAGIMQPPLSSFTVHVCTAQDHITLDAVSHSGTYIY